jgi:predicted O-linked N-acetylglucosamine transferase (SPINDLY family)
MHDGVTGRIASLVDQWHDVHLLSDDDIAALVRAHQIDILVDLCGHGPGNRILALARKPAPLQVNYLDYSATTGLSSIDYRLTTEYCDPSGTSEQYYSEKLYRLKDTYWTYNPAVRLPVSALPMESNGYVTFGSFNLYYRITGEVLDLWSRLLMAIPGSRLLIVSVAAGSTQAALLERLNRAGIARDRVSMHGLVSYQTYNELMGTVDIALAPYPYNGATTVMDCLWNGLPVVAKQGGETFSTRLGCSVLAEMGLSELIARDEDEYIRIAAGLASAVPELASLRRTLREKLERSPMRDFPGFTRGLELAYRSMWKDWCRS